MSRYIASAYTFQLLRIINKQILCQKIHFIGLINNQLYHIVNKTFIFKAVFKS